MARNEFSRLEWEGLKELEKEFNRMDEQFQEILTDEFGQYTTLVEEGARALVQYDEGNLEESIIATDPVIKGGAVEVEIGSNMVYALRRHEEPYRQGTYPKYDNGAKFEDYYVNGLGRGTRGKPAWRGMTPGRKFLERAIFATEEDWNEMQKRVLDRTLRDKR